MGTIVYDCPHEGCRAKNISFNSEAVSKFSWTPEGGGLSTYVWNMFCTCSACRRGVVFVVRNKKPTQGERDVSGLSAAAAASFIEIIDVWPPAPEPALVPNVPEPVARSLAEAEANVIDARWPSAATCYRTTVERALKILDPDAKGTLYKRIEGMNGRLPPDLIELLHEVRFLGNDGAHDLDDPAPEDVAGGREFVRLFLIYTFDLPARIAAAKAQRGAP